MAVPPLSDRKNVAVQVLHRSKYRLKQVLVTVLIVAALAGEAVPEETAKLVVVPALVGAILAEALVREW